MSIERRGLRDQLRLCLITDTAMCGERGVPAVVRAAVAGGVSMVQVRSKNTSDRDLLALTLAVRECLTGTGVPLIVDDAVDVAVLAGADGVHVGQTDLPTDLVRQWVGPDFIIGLSVSTMAQAVAAEAADYLGIGPIWATATKPDAAGPVGPAGLATLVAATALPTVAIGGIHADTVPQLAGTGVDGVCTVSEICAAPDPTAAAARLRAAVDDIRRTRP